MALQMGEVEVKIKANIDDAKSTLQELEGADVEINATVTVDDSELTQLEGSSHEIKFSVTGDDEAEGKAGEVKAAVDAVPDENNTNLKATDNVSETATKATGEVDAVPDENNTDLKATDNVAATATAATGEINLVPDANNTNLTATDNVAAAASMATTEIDAVPDKNDTNLTASDNVATAASAATNEIDAVPDLNNTNLVATDNVSTAASSATAEINLVPDENNTDLKATDNVVTAATNATNEINAVPDSNDTKLTATDNVAAAAATATSEVDAVPDSNNTNFTATDNASTTVEKVGSGVSSIPNDKNTKITANDNTSTGITAAQQSLASLPNEEPIDIVVNSEGLTTQIATSAQAGLDKVDTTTFGEKIKGAFNSVKEVFEKIGNFNDKVADVYNKTIGAVWEKTFEAASDVDDTMTTAVTLGMYDQSGYAKVNRMNWMADLMDVDVSTMQTALRTVKSDLESMFVEDKAGLVGSTYEAVEKSNAEKIKTWRSSRQFEALGGMLGQGYNTANEALATFGAQGLQEQYMRYIASQDKSKWEGLALELFGTRGSALLPEILQMATYIKDDTGKTVTAYDYWNKLFSTGIYAYASSEEVTGPLLEMKDQWSAFQAAWDALKKSIFKEFAPVFTSWFKNLRVAIQDCYKILSDDSLSPGEKMKQVFKRIWKSISDVWADVKSWWTEDIWPNIQPYINTIVEWVGFQLDKLWVGIVNTLSTTFPLLFGGSKVLTGQKIDESDKNSLWDKLKENGNSFKSDEFKTGIKDKETIDNIANYVTKYYADNYGVDGLDATVVSAFISSQLTPENLKKAGVNFDANTVEGVSKNWKVLYSFIAGLDYNSLIGKKGKTTTTDTGTKDKEGDVPLTGWADLQQSLNTAYDNFTASNNSLASTLANMSLAVNVNEGTVTVNCYGGATADVSKGTTQVEKYNADKKSGSNFANAAGSYSFN